MFVTNTALEFDIGPADKLAIDLSLIAMSLVCQETFILGLASSEWFRPCAIDLNLARVSSETIRPKLDPACLQMLYSGVKTFK
jgi:hypothetical protein